MTEVARVWYMQILTEFLGLTLTAEITNNGAVHGTDLTRSRKVIFRSWTPNVGYKRMKEKASSAFIWPNYILSLLFQEHKKYCISKIGATHMRLESIGKKRPVSQSHSTLLLPLPSEIFVFIDSCNCI